MNNKNISIVLSLTAIFIFLSVSTSIGQNIGISETLINADASSILELQSSSKGMLVPRMTQSQRDAIESPETSLLIFNTQSNCFEFWALGMWNKLGCADACAVGTYGYGGIIAYLFTEGQEELGYVSGECHGYVVTATNFPAMQWGCQGIVISGLETDIGAGQSNTNEIVSQCNDVMFAAKYCSELVVTDGGISYNDWFLPSRLELDMILHNVFFNDFGTYENGLYWCSNQHPNPTYTASDALVQSWVTGASTGLFYGDIKSHQHKFVCLRKF